MKTRLNTVLRALNISLNDAVDHLESINISIEPRPTTKIDQETLEALTSFANTEESEERRLKRSEGRILREKREEAINVQRRKNLIFNRAYLRGLGVCGGTILSLEGLELLQAFKWVDMPIDIKISIADNVIKDKDSNVKAKLKLATKTNKTQKVIHDIVMKAKDLITGSDLSEDVLACIRVGIPNVQLGRITITTHENARKNLYLWDKDNNRILHSTLN